MTQFPDSIETIPSERPRVFIAYNQRDLRGNAVRRLLPSPPSDAPPAKAVRKPHKPSLARLVAKAKQLGVDVTVEPDGAVTFRTGTVSTPDDKPQTDLAEWIARQHAH
jgi:hypothetical protein